MFSNKMVVSMLFAGFALVGCGSGKDADFEPIANKAPQISTANITADEQTTVILRSVVEDEGTVLSYQWTQTAGMAVDIVDIDGETAKFVAPTVNFNDGPQTLSFIISATDNFGAQSQASVDVTINPINNTPVALIDGPDNGQSFGFVDTVLNGGDSYDSDGTLVSYQWQQVSGEPVVLNGADSAQLRVKLPNKNSSFEFLLTVTDNEGQSAQTSIALNNQPYFLKVGTGREQTCALMNDANGKDVYCWQFDNEWSGPAPQLHEPVDLEVGYQVACALSQDGLTCWGLNMWGQLEVPELVAPSDVAIGYRHVCALDSNGVSCWGYDSAGETVVPALVNPIQVVAGYRYSCALDDNGVSCWGITPQMPQLSGVTQLFAGTDHMCALNSSGLNCWGYNGSNQVVNLALNPQSVVDVALGEKHTCVSTLDEQGATQTVCYGDIPQPPAYQNGRSLTAGGDHSCLIDDSGVHCWGNAYQGQTSPPLFEQVNTLASGFAHSCAIGSLNGISDQMACWGEDGLHEYDIPLIADVKTVAANDFITCATLLDDSAKCWGIEPENIESPSNFPFPEPAGELIMPELHNVSAIVPGYQSICALSDAGVQCWGADSWGYYGVLNVPTLTNPTMLASGDTFHCAVADEGLQCWGSFWGYWFDVPVPTLSNITSLSAQDGFACAIAQGEVHCWGTAPDDIFTIPPLRNPQKIAVGSANVCALDDSGVVCWGDNRRGQLRVPKLSNPSDITVGYTYMCAKDDTGLVCWGWQGYGDNPAPTREQAEASWGYKSVAQNKTSVALPPSKMLRLNH